MAGADRLLVVVRILCRALPVTARAGVAVLRPKPSPSPKTPTPRNPGALQHFSFCRQVTEAAREGPLSVPRREIRCRMPVKMGIAGVDRRFAAVAARWYGYALAIVWCCVPMTPDLSEQRSSDATAFAVLINHEEQYALWPADKALPEKWRHAGMTGTREDCLTFIRQAWTDMRPLRVRQRRSEIT